MVPAICYQEVQHTSWCQSAKCIADRMHSIESDNATYSVPTGSFRMLNMRILGDSLGRRPAVLHLCKVPPAGLCHVSGFNDRRLSQHKRNVQTHLYHARVSDIHIKKSFCS